MPTNSYDWLIFGEENSPNIFIFQALNFSIDMFTHSHSKVKSVQTVIYLESIMHTKPLLLSPQTHKQQSKNRLFYSFLTYLQRKKKSKNTWTFIVGIANIVIKQNNKVIKYSYTHSKIYLPKNILYSMLDRIHFFVASVSGHVSFQAFVVFMVVFEH